MPDARDADAGVGEGLNARHAVAQAALLEITAPSSVGAFRSETDEGDGVFTLLFETALAGYPGWAWTVHVAEVDGAAPTVLEAELLPGDGALLAPDWLPWADRLEEYQASQAAEGDAADDGSDDDESEDDDEYDDESDDDESDDDESDDDDDDSDDDDPDDDDDLGEDLYDGVDIEQAVEAAEEE